MGDPKAANIFVAEADESDHSFVKTPAFGGIVTNLDNDHLNYWKTASQLEEAFQLFFDQASSENHLFWCGDDQRLSNFNDKRDFVRIWKKQPAPNHFL